MNFLEKNKTIIFLILLILIFINGCNTNRKINKLEEKIYLLSGELNKKISVEGLKTEKRFIQSTDRKLLDLNREKEIDIELSKLKE